MVKTALDSGSQLLDAKCVMTEIMPHAKWASKQHVLNKLTGKLCSRQNTLLVAWCAASLKEVDYGSINKSENVLDLFILNK